MLGTDRGQGLGVQRTLGCRRRHLVSAVTAHVTWLGQQRGVPENEALQVLLDTLATAGIARAAGGELPATVHAAFVTALEESDLLDIIGWLVEDTRQRERLGSYYTESDTADFLTRTAVAGALLDRLQPLLGDAPWLLLTRRGDELLRLPAEAEPIPGEPPLQAQIRLEDRLRQSSRLLEGAVRDSRDALRTGVVLDRLLLETIKERVAQDVSVREALWHALEGFLIMDCSAGSGQLLLPAARLLLQVYEHVTVPEGPALAERLAAHFLAADRDPVALHGSALRLALVLLGSGFEELREADLEDLRKTLADRTVNLDVLARARQNGPKQFQSDLPVAADVVVGNPPYLPNRDWRHLHSDWRTRSVPDVCGLFLEQAVCNNRVGGWTAFVLPLSMQSTRNYGSVRDLLVASYRSVAVASFSRRPSSLFPRAGIRTALVIAAGRVAESASVKAVLSTTAAYRWAPAFRPHLFDSIVVRALPEELVTGEGWSRLPNAKLANVFATLRRAHPLGLSATIGGTGEWAVGVRGNALYELTAFTRTELLHVEVEGRREPQSMMRWFPTRTEDDQDALLAVLLSRFALVWWHCHGDDLNVTRRTLESIPMDLNLLRNDDKHELVVLGRRLRAELPQVRTVVRYGGRTVEGYAVRLLREITDEVDMLLAEAFGYADALSALAAAYEGVTRGLPAREATGPQPVRPRSTR